MVQGGGAFGSQLVYEGGVPPGGRELHFFFSVFVVQWRMRKMTLCESETWHSSEPDIVAPDPLEIWKTNNYCLSHLFQSILLQQSKLTKAATPMDFESKISFFCYLSGSKELQIFQEKSMALGRVKLSRKTLFNTLC